MSMETLVLSGIGLYMLILMGIAYYAQKTETENDFIIGSRKVGIIPTIASLSSSFRDGSGIVLWIGFGFALGYAGVFYFIGGALISASLMAIFGPRVREIAAKNNYVTVGQMINSVIGKQTKNIASIIIALVALVAVSMQLYVSGNLVSKIADISPIYGIVSAAIVVACYLLAGGYGAVVKTDTIQFFIIISLICVPIFITPSMADVTNFATINGMPLIDRIAFFGVGVIYFLASADAWQRLFSAKDKKTIQRSVPMAPICLLIMTLSLIFVGMGVKPFMTEPDSNNVFFRLFELKQISKYVLAYLAVVVMAITMSTLDTFTYLFSSTILEDFTKYDIKKHRKQYIRWSKIIMGTLLAVTSVAALYIGNLVQLIFAMMSLVYILAPIFVVTGMGWIKKSNKIDRAIAISTVINIGIYAYMFVNDMFAQFINSLIPAGTSLIGLLICMALFNKEKQS